MITARAAEAMHFCFDALTRGTIAEGAQLQIVTTPGAGICLACHAEFAMQELYGLCPACGSPRLQITTGKQMRVRDLAVE